MVEFIKDLNDNHKNNLILIFLLFSIFLLKDGIQNRIKLLYNVFPINLSHKLGWFLKDT